MTFGIVAGVGQCLQACSRLLPRWLGPDWRRLFNAALQGQRGVISAQQIVRLADLVQLVRKSRPPKSGCCPIGVISPLTEKPSQGLSSLQAFEAFLEDYGHRAVGESDIMSPRMAEQPESILAVLGIQARAPSPSTASDLLNRQEQCRREALTEIRRRVGWRWDRWALFHWWYRRLTRSFALREANRHHLMYYSTAVRHLLLRAGELLAAEGRISQPDDIFFVTLEERTGLFTGESRD